MRILLVSHYFPPYDHIGSARTGKTAKYLELFGHDVRILTARDTLTPFAQMPVEIDPAHIIYTNWISAPYRADLALNRLAQAVAAGIESRAKPLPLGSPRTGQSRAGKSSAWKSLGHGIRDGLRTICYFPDAQIGWYPYAVRAGRELIRGWRPDVILASSGPHTGLLVARSLARKFGIPWVAEFRDLWVDNHGYQHPDWRKKIEALVEKRVVSDAGGLVTVSEPLADTLRAAFRLDVEVVYNGFDPGDHGEGAGGAATRNLEIVYTGWTYPQQTLRPLFMALRTLGRDASDVRVVFYRSNNDMVRAAAAEEGLEHLVELRQGVPFMESLRRQKEADVLLYLSWNDREQTGIFSGKLFQYFGAARPVLAVGPTDNAPAAVIREFGLGFASSDSEAIAVRIAEWLKEKRTTGMVEAIPPARAAEFTRENQTRRLERFLARVAARDFGAERELYCESAGLRRT